MKWLLITFWHFRNPEHGSYRPWVPSYGRGSWATSNAFARKKLSHQASCQPHPGTFQSLWGKPQCPDSSFCPNPTSPGGLGPLHSRDAALCCGNCQSAWLSLDNSGSIAWSTTPCAHWPTVQPAQTSALLASVHEVSWKENWFISKPVHPPAWTSALPCLCFQPCHLLSKLTTDPC